MPRPRSRKNASIIDIATTVAYVLSIQEPNACSGQPLQEVLRY